jgi:hypothetical protein
MKKGPKNLVLKLFLPYRVETFRMAQPVDSFSCDWWAL